MASLSTSATAPEPAPSWVASLRRIAWPIGGFAIVLVLWQAVASSGRFPVYLFPPPADVAAELYKAAFVTGILWTNIAVSGARVLLAYIPSIGGGILLGLLMGSSGWVAKLLGGVVAFIQAIPPLAWIPLAILWFGIGPGSVTFIIFLSVFFPVLYSTITGVRSIPGDYLNVARMCELGRFRMLFQVMLPGALASVLTGVRVGASHGWRAMVGAELIASSNGLGYMIFDARQYLRTSLVIVGMVSIGSIWLLIDTFVLRRMERATVERWGVLKDVSK